MAATKFLVVGHGCVDLTPEITAANIFSLVRPGTLVPTGPAKFSIGGAVPNTGAALARLGNPHVYLRCPTAVDAFGDVLRNLLTQLGFSDTSMDLRFTSSDHDSESCSDDVVAATSAVCTSFSIIISPKGQDRFILHCPGVNPSLRARDILSVPLEAHDWLHLGYPPLLDTLTRNEGAELRAVFAPAKARGLTTSLDMCTPDTSKNIDWRAIFRHVLPLVHCFTPSFEEICMCLGIDDAQQVPSLAVLRAISDELIAFGAPVVLLKLSSHGLYLRTADSSSVGSGLGRGAEQGLSPEEIVAFRKDWSEKEIFAPSFSVECVGTLGAGDCTIAAFLTCTSLRAEPRHGAATQTRWLCPSEVLQVANAVGACNVEAEDALSGVRDIEATRKRIAAGWARNDVPLQIVSDKRLDDWGNINLKLLV